MIDNNNVATVTLFINTKSESTFLNGIAWTTTNLVIPNVAPTIAANKIIKLKMIEKTILASEVNKDTSSGIAKNKIIAIKINPIANSDPNNLKLNVCILLISLSGSTKAFLKKPLLSAVTSLACSLN